MKFNFRHPLDGNDKIECHKLNELMNSLFAFASRKLKNSCNHTSHINSRFRYKTVLGSARIGLIVTRIRKDILPGQLIQTGQTYGVFDNM